jgi:recombination protein RecR
MLEQLPALVQLLKSLQQVPYLSSKNLYRVADHFLHSTAEQIEQFCTILSRAHAKIKPCKNCFCWYQIDAHCLFCNDPKRKQNVVCVVETWQELLAIEKTKGYDGVFHVLGGVICPLDGIGPEDLTINALIARVQTGQVTEIILATNQTPEGEATAAYIARKLKNESITISCLARGLPVGSSIEHMDKLTIYKALSERRPF